MNAKLFIENYPPCAYKFVKDSNGSIRLLFNRTTHKNPVIRITKKDYWMHIRIKGIMRLTLLYNNNMKIRNSIFEKNKCIFVYKTTNPKINRLTICPNDKNEMYIVLPIAIFEDITMDAELMEYYRFTLTLQQWRTMHAKAVFLDVYPVVFLSRFRYKNHGDQFIDKYTEKYEIKFEIIEDMPDNVNVIVNNHWYTVYRQGKFFIQEISIPLGSTQLEIWII